MSRRCPPNDRRLRAVLIAFATLALLPGCVGPSPTGDLGRDELATASAPSGNDHLTAIGDRMLAAGDTANALGAFRQAATAPGAPPEAMLRYARALLQTGEPDYAAGAFADALDRRPGNSDARRGLGVAQLARGKPEEARPHLEQSVRERADARSIRALAVLRTMEGQVDEARAVYGKALAKWPQDLDLRANDALFEALAGNCSEAENQAGRVATSPYVRAQHVAVQALTLALCGKEAEAAQRAAPAMSPDGARALLQKAARARAAESLAAKAVILGVVPSQGGGAAGP
jgi:Flp pilus assembly protein TadD